MKTKVFINFIFQDGIVIVTGKHYKNWLVKFFYKWKLVVIGDLGLSASEIKETPNLCDRDRLEEAIAEIEKIWDEFKAFKSAIAMIEESVMSLQKSQDTLTQSLDKRGDADFQTAFT